MNVLKRTIIGLLVIILGSVLFIWGSYDHIPRWLELMVSTDWPAILGIIGGCSAVFAAVDISSAWQDYKWSKREEK